MQKRRERHSHDVVSLGGRSLKALVNALCDQLGQGIRIGFDVAPGRVNKSVRPPTCRSLNRFTFVIIEAGAD
jgi:hypothetical protein